MISYRKLTTANSRLSAPTMYYHCSISEKMDIIGSQFAVNMITLLCFDSFGRSLSQMEISYSEPKFQQYILNALPGCAVFTNTQAIQNHATAVCGWYAILVGKLFSMYKSIDHVSRLSIDNFFKRYVDEWSTRFDWWTMDGQNSLTNCIDPRESIFREDKSNQTE